MMGKECSTKALNELIQLYGLDNLPDNIREERELNRWREIMAQTNWKLQRQTQYRASEKPLDRELPPNRLQPHPRFIQDDLPYFQQQDDREAFIRHKQAMAKRAFDWYRLSKKKGKSKLIDIYNGIATMKQRD